MFSEHLSQVLVLWDQSQGVSLYFCFLVCSIGYFKTLIVMPRPFTSMWMNVYGQLTSFVNTPMCVGTFKSHWKTKPCSFLRIWTIFSKVLQGGDVFLHHDGIDVPASMGRWRAVPLTPVVWHLKGSASAAGLFWMNMLNAQQGVGGVVRQCHSRAGVSLIAHFLLPACCCTQRGCWKTNLEL